MHIVWALLWLVGFLVFVFAGCVFVHLHVFVRLHVFVLPRVASDFKVLHIFGS